MADLKVVMIDYDYQSLELFEKTLAEFGVDFTAKNCSTIDEAKALAKDADGVIIQKLGPIDDDFMGALDKCRVLARTGIGTDPIDIEAATRHGMAVVNVPGYCAEEVSEHAFSLLLACARKIRDYAVSVASGEWDFNIGSPVYRLCGTTIGLVGFGQIPRRVVPKAHGFDMKVIAYDPFVETDDMAKVGVEKVTLEELLQRADFVSLHAPLTKDTDKMIGAEQLKMMKKSAYLINTSRGQLIDEKALADALESGDIAGAGLDVFCNEPPGPDNPLPKLKNVVATPHAAYYSEQSLHDLHVKLSRNVGNVLKGKMPEALVNPDVAEKLKLE